MDLGPPGLNQAESEDVVDDGFSSSAEDRAEEESVGERGFTCFIGFPLTKISGGDPPGGMGRVRRRPLGVWGEYTLGGDPWGEYTLGGDPSEELVVEIGLARFIPLNKISEGGPPVGVWGELGGDPWGYGESTP